MYGTCSSTPNTAVSHSATQWVRNSSTHAAGTRRPRWGYTHVLMDNPSSVIWHHMFGFDAVQTVNCVNIGDRYWWKVPFSASPRFGPLSRHGRHDDESAADPIGSGLLPPEWPQKLSICHWTVAPMGDNGDRELSSTGDCRAPPGLVVQRLRA